jgi:putative addiction module CopG family antidote
MPSDQTRNVSLTAELNAFIRAQVDSGHYQNASEVVRAGLRLLAQQAERQALPPLPQAEKLRSPRAAVRGRHARQV